MASDRNFQSNVLIVRHLPMSLNASDKEELLKHFGAVSVKCMADRGRMKHTAFATFTDHDAATQALHRLHQLDVLGQSLTVEYAKTRRQVALATPDLSSRSSCSLQGSVEDRKGKIAEKETKSFNAEELHRQRAVKKMGLSPDLGISHPINPRLKYHYPPPTVSILSNIVNALASVPKFYVQTLHLMNKMNLPAPFGPLTPAPPLDDDEVIAPPEPEDATPVEMEVASSSEESELESDEETREQARKVAEQLGHAVKRPLKKKVVGQQRKRPRLQDMIAQAAAKSVVSGAAPGGGALPRGEVFDPAETALGKKAEIRLAESITVAVERQIQQGKGCVYSQPTPTGQEEEQTGAFGMFQPTKLPVDAKAVEKEDEDEDEDDDGPESSEFITREQLKKKKLSKDEMKHISVFKNYSSGDPTTRLYIKNLAKQVEEKDLKFIYGRYIDWSSPMDKDMFNIQLMKQGRMKGQAFVGLPSELAAQKALRDTNGFVLHDKPIVVSFARSAKPKEKEDAKDTKKPAAKRPRDARRI
ncbi:RNA-binding region-containing protein 3-like [Diadema antillarum]|uniref:RNA-binding region-containing protein 3-like n=1 Tax=Diadema antillarum TaxID=105358 RepID=UPI003A89A7A1